MSRTFEGKVSLIKNTNGEVALKRDLDGKWDATMAVALYERMQELSKTLNAPLHKWSLYVVDGGVDAVLMASSTTTVSLRLSPSSDNLPCSILNSAANPASTLADTTVYLLCIGSITFSNFMLLSCFIAGHFTPYFVFRCISLGLQSC